MVIYHYIDRIWRIIVTPIFLYNICEPVNTFRFNSKCSLLKLLCTLSCLCEGTPLQPHRLDFFGLTFNHILAHNIKISISHYLLAGRKTEQGERRADPMIVLSFPTCPPPWNLSTNHLPLIHRQINLHTVQRHFASHCTAGGMSPLYFTKLFLHSLTLFLLLYCLDSRWREGILEKRRRMIPIPISGRMMA